MFVSLLGVLITLGAVMFSFRNMTHSRLLIAIGLAVLHVAASVGYYYFSLANVADARTYYLDPMNMANDSFGLGTVFVYKLTYLLKVGLGGSYFDCFIFFQAIGFWGLAFLMRTFEEIEARAQVPALTVPLLLLCLPSIHFWTGSIGKDAPVFLGLCICTWAVLRLRSRLITFSAGVLLILLFRPHIALVVVASVAAAGFLARDVSFGRKMMVVALTFGTATLLATAIQTTFRVDISDPTAIGGYLDERDQIAAKVGGGTAVGDAPMYVRVVSLLFRPFFIDADGAAAMIASLENVAILIAFLYLLKSWGTLLFLFRKVFFVKYAAFVSLTTVVILTLVYYNVGLGLRQRVMAFPTFLSLLACVWAMRTRIRTPQSSATMGARPKPSPVPAASS